MQLTDSNQMFRLDLQKQIYICTQQSTHAIDIIMLNRVNVQQT